MLANGYVPTDNSLTVACRRGYQTLVLKLLQYQHIDAQPGFMKAVIYNHLHLLDYLYTRIDVNKADELGTTALHCVTDVRVAQWLLDMGARQLPDNNGHTPLHIACRFGRIGVINLLLQKATKQEIQTPNNNRYTPLHFACVYGSIKIVELLLQQMNDHEKYNIIQLPNIYKHTPLYCAQWYGHTNIVKLFVQYITNYHIPAVD